MIRKQISPYRTIAVLIAAITGFGLGTQPAFAAVVFYEDFAEAAGGWDNGTNATQAPPGGKYLGLLWHSPNVNSDIGTLSGNTAAANGVMFLHSGGNGFAELRTAQTFAGDITVSADITTANSGLNIGIVMGKLYVLFHPGLTNGLLRVERLTGEFQPEAGAASLITNQNVGFNPSSGFANGLHHLEVGVDTVNKQLNIKLTDGSIGNSSTPYTLQIGYTTGDYVPGTDHVGVRRTSSGTIWIDNLTVTAVPEPATVGLFSMGILALMGLAYRRSRQRVTEKLIG